MIRKYNNCKQTYQARKVFKKCLKKDLDKDLKNQIRVKMSKNNRLELIKGNNKEKLKDLEPNY